MLRLLLSLLTAAACCTAACTAACAMAASQAAPSRPNVVVIMTDDLGYGDLGCTGSRQVLSPNIDRLAETGVFCERAYAAAPMCAPSRMALMTGRQPKRYGITMNPNWKDPNLPESRYGLPTTERMLPDYLNPLGYCCGVVGKWHLGHTEGQRPQDRGFARWWGFLGGSRSYLPMAKEQEGLNPSRIVSNYDPTPQVSYLTDDVTREALRFIREQGARKQPFFLFVAYNAPHWPLESLPADREATKRHAAAQGAPVPAGDRLHYCAMIHAVDRGVGQIVEALREQGVAADTLVFFMSDNGGAPEAPASNAPWRGHKRLHYDGGVRVPFIVSCAAEKPGPALPADAFKPGSRCRKLVSLMDVLPTVLDLNDQDAPDAMDGRSLLPALRGEPTAGRRLEWCTAETNAILADGWKLLRAKGVPPRLYCLREDPTEQRDRSASEPEILRCLARELDAYLNATPAPRYSDNPAWGQKLLREHTEAKMMPQR